MLQWQKRNKKHCIATKGIIKDSIVSKQQEFNTKNGHNEITNYMIKKQLDKDHFKTSIILLIASIHKQKILPHFETSCISLHKYIHILGRRPSQTEGGFIGICPIMSTPFDCHTHFTAKEVSIILHIIFFIRKPSFCLSLNFLNFPRHWAWDFLKTFLTFTELNWLKWVTLCLCCILEFEFYLQHFECHNDLISIFAQQKKLILKIESRDILKNF